MTLLAALPLRTTAEWGSYREPQAIPLRYGSTGGVLLQYSSDRYRWVWAGHAVSSVDSVKVNGVEVGNWLWRNTTDSTGQPIALVEFDQPADEGVTITARGRGKLSAGSGELMTNPADVLLDILTLAGQQFSGAQLSGFRRDCLAEGLEVAGSIEVADSALTVIRSICDSVGAIFAPDSPRVAALRRSSPSSPVATVKAANLSGLTCSLDAIFNDITVRHDWDSGAPGNATRLIAPESIRVYGRRASVIDAFWLPASARIAAAVATRYLQRVARPTWNVSAFDLRQNVRVGDAITAQFDQLPTATAQALTIERDLTAGRTAIEFTLPAGALPAVEIAQLSERSQVATYAGVAVAVVGDTRVLTVVKNNGQPDVGAVVTIGGASMFTDGAGKVSIPVALMPRGNHLVTIRYTDGQTMQSTVTV